jgi:hypothetical protein
MVTQSSLGGYRYGNQRADKRSSTYQLTEEDEFGLSGRTPGLERSIGPLSSTLPPRPLASGAPLPGWLFKYSSLPHQHDPHVSDKAKRELVGIPEAARVREGFSPACESPHCSFLRRSAA